MLAALSSQPHLADKLRLMVLMAPVATARHATSVPLQAMAAIGTEGVSLLRAITTCIFLLVPCLPLPNVSEPWTEQKVMAACMSVCFV